MTQYAASGECGALGLAPAAASVCAVWLWGARGGGIALRGVTTNDYSCTTLYGS